MYDWYIGKLDIFHLALLGYQDNYLSLEKEKEILIQGPSTYYVRGHPPMILHRVDKLDMTFNLSNTGKYIFSKGIQ